MKAVLVTLLLVVIALIALKPNESDFVEWYKESLVAENPGFGDRLLNSAMSAQSKMTTSYQNYVIFAITTNRSGLTKNKYLGIAKTWFKI
ncbi:MAG: hypothetical protein WCY87_06080 [Candidatus Cloacimonadales bacterium]|nr:hypothetical protein [Candidatus Cloacimonadota bacterium]MCB5269273.1 hypothetical protein [Candidatus Cloacimonadota bacterium]MDD3299461.1 hypothetical protein [Bacteroidales bacterium]